MLHDFCMCIPYGIFVAAGGLISLLFGCGQPGLIVTAAGVAQIFLANVSLKRWRSGKGSTLYTLVEAGLCFETLWRWRLQKRNRGTKIKNNVVSLFFTNLLSFSNTGIASAVAYYSWQSYQAGIRRLATGSLFGLSVAAALFFVYNIIAGGNPPRKEEGEKKKE